MALSTVPLCKTLNGSIASTIGTSLVLDRRANLPHGVKFRKGEPIFDKVKKTRCSYLDFERVPYSKLSDLDMGRCPKLKSAEISLWNPLDVEILLCGVV